MATTTRNITLVPTPVRFEDLLGALGLGEADGWAWLEEPGVWQERAGAGEEEAGAQTVGEREARLLARYEREVEGLQGCVQEKLHKLVKLAQGGDAQARRRVVERHLKMVVRIARRIGRGHGDVSLLDLIQEGNMELLHVSRAYRGKAWTFTDHAAGQVVRAVEVAVARQKRAVGVSREVAAEVARVRQRVRQVAEGEGVEVGEVEDLVGVVARGLGLSRERVQEALDISAPALSLEALPEEYVVAVDEVDGSEAEARARGLLYAQVDVAVEGLPAFTRRVVELRYGLGGQEAHSVEEVSALLSIRAEEIERLERCALGLLRGPLTVFAQCA